MLAVAGRSRSGMPFAVAAPMFKLGLLLLSCGAFCVAGCSGNSNDDPARSGDAASGGAAGGGGAASDSDGAAGDDSGAGGQTAGDAADGATEYCPSSWPKEGSSCAYTGDEKCLFRSGGCYYYYSCQDGLWSVETVSMWGDPTREC